MEKWLNLTKNSKGFNPSRYYYNFLDLCHQNTIIIITMIRVMSLLVFRNSSNYTGTSCPCKSDDLTFRFWLTIGQK